MSYRLLLLCYCLLIIACQNSTEPIKSNEAKEDKTSENIDTVATAENSIIEAPDSSVTLTNRINEGYAPSKNSKEIKALLEQPIDLIAFKKECSGNNSGFKKQPYFFEPVPRGFYYKYFLFLQCGCSSDFNDLVLVVYKFGKKIGRYSDTTETLIAVGGSCALDKLGRLNLVGKKWSSIQALYGTNYLTIGTNRIYTHQGKLLILDIDKQERIRYFKYVKTNLEEIKSIENIPRKALEKFFKK